MCVASFCSLVAFFFASFLLTGLAYILTADIPIPGSRAIERLHENMQSAHLAAKLSPEDIREIREWVNKADVQGDRYPVIFQRPNECGKLEDWKGE